MNYDYLIRFRDGVGREHHFTWSSSSHNLMEVAEEISRVIPEESRGRIDVREIEFRCAWQTYRVQGAVKVTKLSP